MSNFIKAIIAVALFIVGCGVAASDNDDVDCGHATVEVSQGDTLWSIIEDVCSGNIAAAVDATVQLNGGTAVIRPGQWLQLP